MLHFLIEEFKSDMDDNFQPRDTPKTRYKVLAHAYSEDELVHKAREYAPKSFLGGASRLFIANGNKVVTIPVEINDVNVEIAPEFLTEEKES